MSLMSAKNKCNKLAKLFGGENLIEKILDNPGVQQQIIDLNQSQLYDKGVEADGTPTGEYSPLTISGTKSYAGKIQKGQPYDHITLKDTAGSYDSMRVEDNGGKAKITATFPDEIEKRFNKSLGLTDESYEELREFIKPVVADEIRKAIAT